MIPYGLASILVMLGAPALVAVAWEAHSVIRSRTVLSDLDRAESSPATHHPTSRDRTHCDACRYARERTKLASRTVQSDGVWKRLDIGRIAPLQHGSPDPGRSRREPRIHCDACRYERERATLVTLILPLAPPER